VFFLSGGPGQAATDGLAAQAAALERVRLERDLVFADQRGTGGAERLSCDLGSPAAAVRAWLTGDFPAEALAECRRRWDRDLGEYTTRNAVRDLEHVRRRLGYPAVHLVAVSYGTRPALAYLRRWPERVRTVTLRGLYPAEAPLPLHVARDAQAALDRVLAGCAADAACRAAYPEARQDVERALAAAARAPKTLALPGGGSLTVDRDVLAGALLFALYSHDRAAAIPAAARAAAAGDVEPWVSLSLGGILPALQSVSAGVYLSVVCSEDEPRIPADGVSAATAGTFLGDGLVRNLARICAGWPRGAADPDDLAPVRAAAPVLVISGDADPVAPPRWAEATLRALPGSAHLVLRNTGHLPSLPPCAARAAAELIARGTTAGLPLDCGAAPPSFVRPAARPPVDSTGPPADVAGTWAMIWQGASGARESGSMVLRQEGSAVHAVLHGQGSLEAEGTVRGRLLVVTGRRLLTRFEIRAEARGDTLRGTLDVLTLHRDFMAVRRR
jgi:pimeloyl-ACP methyl ester carboxylesterase